MRWCASAWSEPGCGGRPAIASTSPVPPSPEASCSACASPESLAVRPRVLLMDEPCSALDPISTSVIEETIRELSQDITIVIVTHNMQQAQRVSDNCALFLVDGEGLPGHIVEAGPTEDLFNNPIDSRTSDYVHGVFG